MRPDQYSEHQQNFEKQLLMEQLQVLQQQKEQQQQQTHQGLQGQQQQTQTQMQQLPPPFAIRQQQQQQEQSYSQNKNNNSNNNTNAMMFVSGDQHQQPQSNFSFSLPPSASNTNLANALHIDLDGLVARLNSNAPPPLSIGSAAVGIQSTFVHQHQNHVSAFNNIGAAATNGGENFFSGAADVSRKSRFGSNDTPPSLLVPNNNNTTTYSYLPPPPPPQVQPASNQVPSSKQARAPSSERNNNVSSSETQSHQLFGNFLKPFPRDLILNSVHRVLFNAGIGFAPFPFKNLNFSDFEQKMNDFYEEKKQQQNQNVSFTVFTTPSKQQQQNQHSSSSSNHSSKTATPRGGSSNNKNSSSTPEENNQQQEPVTRFFIGQLPYDIHGDALWELSWVIWLVTDGLVFVNPDQIDLQKTVNTDARTGEQTTQYRGAAHLSVPSDLEDIFVASLHKRVLFDDYGIWVARDTKEMQLMNDYCCSLKFSKDQDPDKHTQYPGRPSKPISVSRADPSPTTAKQQNSNNNNKNFHEDEFHPLCDCQHCVSYLRKNMKTLFVNSYIKVSEEKLFAQKEMISSNKSGNNSYQVSPQISPALGATKQQQNQQQQQTPPPLLPLLPPLYPSSASNNNKKTIQESQLIFSSATDEEDEDPTAFLLQEMHLLNAEGSDANISSNSNSGNKNNSNNGKASSVESAHNPMSFQLFASGNNNGNAITNGATYATSNTTASNTPRSIKDFALFGSDNQQGTVLFPSPSHQAQQVQQQQQTSVLVFSSSASVASNGTPTNSFRAYNNNNDLNTVFAPLPTSSIFAQQQQQQQKQTVAVAVVQQQQQQDDGTWKFDQLLFSTHRDQGLPLRMDAIATCHRNVVAKFGDQLQGLRKLSWKCSSDKQEQQQQQNNTINNKRPSYSGVNAAASNVLPPPPPFQQQQQQQNRQERIGFYRGPGGNGVQNAININNNNNRFNQQQLPPPPVHQASTSANARFAVLGNNDRFAPPPPSFSQSQSTFGYRN